YCFFKLITMKTSTDVSYKSYSNPRNLFKISSFPLGILTSIDGLSKNRYPLTMYNVDRKIITAVFSLLSL
ncbi:MAG: hypothetical protein ACRD9Q_06600, partial [Nitrososphaeraceae archaeon]